jgi:nucleotide-binding universal stress UspA family protein
VTVVRGPRRIDAGSLPVVLAVADPDVDSAAVEFAFTDAERRGGTLVVLHVAPGPRGTSATAEALESRLQPWHDRYPTVPVEVRIEQGPVVEALLGSATRARMVVAGARGRGALTGAVLGSTSRALVKLGMCPVTIVPRSLTVAEVVGPTSIPEAVR